MRKQFWASSGVGLAIGTFVALVAWAILLRSAHALRVRGTDDLIEDRAASLRAGLEAGGKQWPELWWGRTSATGRVDHWFFVCEGSKGVLVEISDRSGVIAAWLLPEDKARGTIEWLRFDADAMSRIGSIAPPRKQPPPLGQSRVPQTR